ncbi:dihydroxyacetone kinase family protein [Promicromonospora sp. NPDC023987]|uniref:dihydroxyacetone kinase family protein n=1 Tax=Promicromonospora sp. NPDC023987 TaxID=3155360 RepID=UPI0033F77097
MTHVYNDSDTFKDGVLTGFAAAHLRYVQRVPDASGFVRAGGPLAGKVSLVIGGGSGHYPSYNGVVGPGFADGAVLGDIFASPSAEQVYRIARAAHGGAGLVLAFGNYAGDRLNFGVAADRLRAEGMDVRVVWVTDDVASAPPETVGDRRGIAGTFTVYKMAGAAAERGDDLDEVERLMRHANASTSSFGVAFDGCTLPGASDALFHVEPGRMDFGLGIHGEPGISSTDWMSASGLAAQLVDRVLAERPASADGRAAVLLNGLGATKYEELYVLWSEVAPRLHAAGLDVVEPEVGELVTSLDMAGCSLTVTWLDDELAPLWRAPADTAAYRRGEATASTLFTERAVAADATVAAAEEVASEESRRHAEVAQRLVATLAATVDEHKERLGEIDAVAGDGDHGIGMSRGSRAAHEAADAAATAGGGVHSVLRAAGTAFGDRAGGTSGILWGLLLETVGRDLGNQEAVTLDRLSGAVRTGAARLREFGRAELGDKTMLDALLPFADELGRGADAALPLAKAWQAAADVATSAAEATAPMVPRVGRARPLAERSVGTPDPGAVSFALIVTAIGEQLTQTSSPTSEES